MQILKTSFFLGECAEVRVRHAHSRSKRAITQWINYGTSTFPPACTRLQPRTPLSSSRRRVGANDGVSPPPYAVSTPSSRDQLLRDSSSQAHERFCSASVSSRRAHARGKRKRNARNRVAGHGARGGGSGASGPPAAWSGCACGLALLAPRPSATAAAAIAGSGVTGRQT